MKNPVGPILRMCDDVDGIVEAIRDDNEGREIAVIDRGSYVRVHADGYLIVTAESLKRNLGDEFEIRSLENMLTSFAGRITTSSTRVEWHLTAAGELPKEGS